ncbi:MAG: polyprenyl synthetase family protein [Methylocystaceae bacterium]
MLIENSLPLYLPGQDAEPSVIAQAMSYAVLNGGKRLRPILLMEAATLNNGGEELLPAACALEYVHSYSLVHDDLPAMDDDDLRRGKPTCHKVFGEDIAILAGDGLLTLAFELLAKIKAPADNVLQALRFLGWAAGWQGMVGGQVMDLSAEGQVLSRQALDQMHCKKTGALIKASLQIGGILTSASRQQLAALDNYGEALGLAFQITDDVLDVAGNEQLLGKPIGSDAKNHKPTYVALYGLLAAQKLAEQQTSQAISALNDFGAEANFLRDLAQAQLTRQF